MVFRTVARMLCSEGVYKMGRLLSVIVLLLVSCTVSPSVILAFVEVPETTNTAIYAYSTDAYGVQAESTSNYAIYAVSYAPEVDFGGGFVANYAGVRAQGADRGIIATTSSSTGYGTYTGGGNGIYAYSNNSAGFGVTSNSTLSASLMGGTTPGGELFLGKICTSANWLTGCMSEANVFRVDRTGLVRANGGYLTGGADVAEHIPVLKSPTLADVVEIDPEHEGYFRPAQTPNSTLVAGVISSNPGLTMNAADPAGDLPEQGPRLALTGRVPVKVSSENGPIRPGDLLVSSSTAGHAMRALANPTPGTIVGKALGSLKQGTGTVEMLIMLR
ncbi:MAG: hypothetical protein C0402_07990 [Thermodesulfovibrio sp.]|nr:hypothetical protein [Thermodesulfovibrio sp.]